MIHQSHTYRDTRTGLTVMAMESVEVARVRELVLCEPWLGREYVAHTDWLKPLPMRYFKGKAPG